MDEWVDFRPFFDMMINVIVPTLVSRIEPLPLSHQPLMLDDQRNKAIYGTCDSLESVGESFSECLLVSSTLFCHITRIYFPVVCTVMFSVLRLSSHHVVNSGNFISKISHVVFNEFTQDSDVA
jgi:hypothetical protein